MSKALFIVVAAFLALQAPAPEAYPGQRNHAEPPKGWYCSNVAKDKAHKCSCKRMGEVTENKCCEPVHEDPTCTVFCHMDHCLCPVTCDNPAHKH